MSAYKKSEDYYNKSFVRSVNAALEGVVHTLQKERSMRLRFFIGFFALLAGIYFNLTGVEFMILCFAVTFVLVAEMFNTAIEATIDLVSDEFHPLAKIAKDVGAGAVFVSAINAALTGYILLFRPIITIIGSPFSLIKQSSWHITLIVILGVIGMVLLIKVIRREKNLLRGGMPSGHSAVAFAVWAVVTLVTGEALVGVLVFLLAVLIAKSRMAVGVHTLGQVIAGGILGTLAALLVFQLLA